MVTTAKEALAMKLEDPAADPDRVGAAKFSDLERELEAAPHVAPRYGRVLLKLSGEVFGAGRLGVDPEVVGELAVQIARVVGEGVQVAVVVGEATSFVARSCLGSGSIARGRTTWACSAR